MESEVGLDIDKIQNIIVEYENDYKEKNVISDLKTENEIIEENNKKINDLMTKQTTFFLGLGFAGVVIGSFIWFRYMRR